MNIIPPKAGVVGFPVAHSLSPTIFKRWFLENNIDATYNKIEVQPGELHTLLPRLIQTGYVGINVTIPLKIEAAEIADEISDSAKKIGAVNCLTFDQNGKILGDNTDVMGIIASLQAIKPAGNWKDAKAIVIGAGGAARGLLRALELLNFGETYIINRTEKRAEILAADFNDPDSNNRLSSHGLDFLTNSQNFAEIDLIVNASSMGMNNQQHININMDKVGVNTTIFDMVYKPLTTKFLAEGSLLGAKTIHGLNMLVHQAVPAFEKWFNCKPKNVTETIEWLYQANKSTARD